MKKLTFLVVFVLTLLGSFFWSSIALAQTSSTFGVTVSHDTQADLQPLLTSQNVGSVLPWNPVKYAIRSAVNAGVPANTIVMLLLLPLVASIIAAFRHLIGLRGFGIFLPAALSVTFLAVGPVVGIGLFLIIVIVSTSTRFILRFFKLKLQYLPRMALILWFVTLAVLGGLFLGAFLPFFPISNVSIFAVLILVLLAEDFTRVQIGKNAKVATNLTIETLILALISYLFLTLKVLQQFAILNPEILLISVLLFDILLGNYSGLRVLELWRFRKLINS